MVSTGYDNRIMPIPTSIQTGLAQSLTLSMALGLLNLNQICKKGSSKFLW